MLEVAVTLFFIDFEASALSAGSWPIEVGFAFLVGREVRSQSKLIKPHESWSMDEWSDKSAEVHGISLEELSAAEPAEAVAEWFLDQTGGGRLVANAPEYDQRWHDRLMATIGATPRTVEDFDDVVRWAFSEEGAVAPGRMGKVFKNLASRRRSVHRAAADAEHLAWAYRAGIPKK